MRATTDLYVTLVEYLSWRHYQNHLPKCLVAILLLLNVFFVAQAQTPLGRAANFAVLSGGTYAQGPNIVAHGRAGALSTNITNVSADTIYAAADTNIVNAKTDVAAFRTATFALTSVTVLSPNTSGDTITLGNGNYELTAGNYNGLVIFANPDSGNSTLLRIPASTILHHATIVEGANNQLPALYIVGIGKLTIDSSTVYGNIVADTIQINGLIKGKPGIFALEGLNLATAELSDEIEINEGFLPSSSQTVASPIAIKTYTCPTSGASTNLVKNPNFTNPRFYNGARLIINPSRNVVQNSPFCDWELIHNNITPDLWFTEAIPSLPYSCDYTCDVTAIPQNRFNGNGFTGTTNPEGALGLEFSLLNREGITQQTATILGTGKYYAAFRLRGLDNTCGGCLQSSNQIDDYYSRRNGPGIYLTNFRPNLTNSRFTNTSATNSNNFYLDRAGRALATTVYLNRQTYVNTNIVTWRQVSGTIEFVNTTNSPSFVTIGNYLKTTGSNLSNVSDYFLFDNIELFRIPAPIAKTVCYPSQATGNTIELVGAALPASAYATYTWSASPAGVISFSNANSLTSTFNVITATPPATVTITLTVQTRKYTGEYDVNTTPVYTVETTQQTATVSIVNTPTLSPLTATVCAPNTALLTLNGYTTGTITWYWRPNLGEDPTVVANQTSSTLVPTQSGYYYAVVTSGSCNSTTQTSQVTIRPEIVFSTPDLSRCYDQITPSIPVSLGSVTPTGGTWSQQAPVNANFNVTSNGTITYSGTNQNAVCTLVYTYLGCTKTTTFTVNESPKKVDDVVCLSDGTYTATVNSGSFVSISNPNNHNTPISGNVITLSNLSATQVHNLSYLVNQGGCPQILNLTALPPLNAQIGRTNIGRPVSYCRECDAPNPATYNVPNFVAITTGGTRIVRLQTLDANFTLVNTLQLSSANGQVPTAGMVPGSTYTLRFIVINVNNSQEISCLRRDFNFVYPETQLQVTGLVMSINDNRADYCNADNGTLNIDASNVQVCAPNPNNISPVSVSYDLYHFRDNTLFVSGSASFNGNPSVAIPIQLTPQEGGLARYKVRIKMYFNGTCYHEETRFLRYEHCCAPDANIRWDNVITGDFVVGSTDNRTLGANTYIRGSIIIKPGGQLTIPPGALVVFAGEAGFEEQNVDPNNGSYYQRPSLADQNRLKHAIVLERETPGNTNQSWLTVGAGATLRAACGSMWQGIVVEKGGALRTIDIRNAIIEDAEVGVDVVEYSDANTNLAARSTITLSTSDVTFNNCYRGIRIESEYGQVLFDNGPRNVRMSAVSRQFPTRTSINCSNNTTLLLPFSSCWNEDGGYRTPAPDAWSHRYVGLTGLEINSSSRAWLDDLTLNNWAISDHYNAIQVNFTPVLVNGVYPQPPTLRVDDCVFTNIHGPGIVGVEQIGNTAPSNAQVSLVMRSIVFNNTVSSPNYTSRFLNYAPFEATFYTEQNEPNYGLDAGTRYNPGIYTNQFNIPAIFWRGLLDVSSTEFRSATDATSGQRSNTRAVGIIGLQDITTTNNLFEQLNIGVVSYARDHRISGNVFDNNQIGIYISGHGLDQNGNPVLQNFRAIGCNRFMFPTSRGQTGIYADATHAIAGGQFGGPFSEVANAWPGEDGNGNSVFPAPLNAPPVAVPVQGYTCFDVHPNGAMVNYFAYDNEVTIFTFNGQVQPNNQGTGWNAMNYQFGNYAQPCQNILPTDLTWYPLRRGVTKSSKQIISKPTLTPNPFSNRLLISNGEAADIKLAAFVNILGQPFTPQATQTADGLVLDTEQLPVGMYQLIVLVDGKTHQFKVLKQ